MAGGRVPGRCRRLRCLVSRRARIFIGQRMKRCYCATTLRPPLPRIILCASGGAARARPELADSPRLCLFTAYSAAICHSEREIVSLDVTCAISPGHLDLFTLMASLAIGKTEEDLPQRRRTRSSSATPSEVIPVFHQGNHDGPWNMQSNAYGNKWGLCYFLGSGSGT